MKYDNITKSVFINRPNRFIAVVEVNGHREIVHVKNAGRCKELLIPGSEETDLTLFGAIRPELYY